MCLTVCAKTMRHHRAPTSTDLSLWYTIAVQASSMDNCIQLCPIPTQHPNTHIRTHVWGGCALSCATYHRNITMTPVHIYKSARMGILRLHLLWLRPIKSVGMQATFMCLLGNRFVTTAHRSPIIYSSSPETRYYVGVCGAYAMAIRGPAAYIIIARTTLHGITTNEKTSVIKRLPH